MPIKVSTSCRLPVQFNMSLKVVKVLQFSISFRNVFGLCPFSLRTDQKVARNQSEVTIESVYLPILGLIITLVVYSLAIYNIIILHVRDGVPFLNEDVFGNDLTTPSSVSFIVLGIAGTMNFLSYILVVLVTFFNRHSWLRIFQETMVIFDKLDKDYSVHCDTLRLRLITNGILAVSIIFHCCFAYYFAPVISFSSVSLTLPVVYLVLTMCTTLSTFDLISTISLLTEIFELHLGIPRHKYNTEMFLTFFESLDLLEDVGNSHGLRECFNSTNQVFGILSHLFIAVYHIQQYGTVNMLFLFGIISAIPRVINLFSIAFFGSLLTTSVSCKTLV